MASLKFNENVWVFIPFLVYPSLIIVYQTFLWRLRRPSIYKPVLFKLQTSCSSSLFPYPSLYPSPFPYPFPFNFSHVPICLKIPGLQAYAVGPESLSMLYDVIEAFMVSRAAGYLQSIKHTYINRIRRLYIRFPLLRLVRSFASLHLTGFSRPISIKSKTTYFIHGLHIKIYIDSNPLQFTISSLQYINKIKISEQLSEKTCLARKCRLALLSSCFCPSAFVLHAKVTAPTITIPEQILIGVP